VNGDINLSSEKYMFYWGTL